MQSITFAACGITILCDESTAAIWQLRAVDNELRQIDWNSYPTLDFSSLFTGLDLRPTEWYGFSAYYDVRIHEVGTKSTSLYCYLHCNT